MQTKYVLTRAGSEVECEYPLDPDSNKKEGIYIWK